VAALPQGSGSGASDASDVSVTAFPEPAYRRAVGLERAGRSVTSDALGLVFVDELARGVVRHPTPASA
jgi:hypothetical protein